MAMKGSIDADYSKFEAECAKAEAGLAKIAEQGKSTETSLVAMENSVASGKVSDAIAKTVANVDKAGTSAKASSSAFGQLADAGRVADKTLNQFGVSLGPTIGTLDEMAKISTKTTGSLGALGTATAVFGAAMAGWNIGRWIADITGADAAIADFTSTLMGGGSVASETYVARLEAVQKAVRDGYVGLPTYSQAIEFNSKKAAENAAQHVTSAARISEWTRDLNTARGGITALKGEIDAGNLTVEEMSKRFDVSARAIDFLKRNMQLAKEETEGIARANEDAAKKAQALADANTKLQASLFGTDSIEQAQKYMVALGGIGNLARVSTEEQTKLNTVVGEAIEAYKRAGQVAPQAMRDLYIETIKLPPVVSGLGAEFANVGTKFTVTADTVIADMKRMRGEAQAYEAETQRLVDEAQKITPPIQAAKEEQQQLTVAMQNFGNVAMTAYESAIAGAKLYAAYAAAGVPTSAAISMGGYEFNQLQQTGVPGGLASYAGS